jgi:type IV secretory pathway VirB3-like protein
MIIWRLSVSGRCPELVCICLSGNRLCSTQTSGRCLELICICFQAIDYTLLKPPGVARSWFVYAFRQWTILCSNLRALPGVGLHMLSGNRLYSAQTSGRCPELVCICFQAMDYTLLKPPGVAQSWFAYAFRQWTILCSNLRALPRVGLYMLSGNGLYSAQTSGRYPELVCIWFQAIIYAFLSHLFTYWIKFHISKNQGYIPIVFKPMHSSSPNMRFRFWIAAPADPLTRLSMAEITMIRSVRSS